MENKGWDLNLVVVDLETTGLRPANDRILEIGAVRVEHGEICATYEKLINPRMQIPYRVQELTGITQDMAERGCDGDEALRGFIDFCGNYPLLGHNVSFDYGFLRHKSVNMGLDFERTTIDTLAIARKTLTDLPSKKLGALCLHYQIQQDHAHRALDDAINTWKLYCNLREEFFEDYPELFSPRLVTYKVKKQGPITLSQKRYLNDLIRYHRIECNVDIESLTKNEASRMIDKIISNHGRIQR